VIGLKLLGTFSCHQQLKSKEEISKEGDKKLIHNKTIPTNSRKTQKAQVLSGR